MKITADFWKFVFPILLAVIFAVLLGVVFYLRQPHDSEPEYQGKKLTDWAKEIDLVDFFRLPAYQQHRQQNEQATVAIRHIGTNALPVVLELCRAKDSWLRVKWENWTRRYNFPAVDKHYEGVNIIWALGTMTKPIVPDLVDLLKSRNTEITEDIRYALPGAGTNAIPPLLKLLNNPDKEIRLRAALVLGDFFRSKIPPNESNGSLIVAGSESFRSQVAAAVPVLLSGLNDPELNLIQHIRVIRALGLMREDAPVVVPILIHRLQIETNRMTDMLVRANYFSALGDYGTNAAAAVPLLVHILESKPYGLDFPPTENVLVNLWQIDSAAALPFIEKWQGWTTNLLNWPTTGHWNRPTIQTNSLSPPVR